MHDREWVEYFTKALAKAEKELAAFESAVEKHGLRVIERIYGGQEQDVTDRHRRMMQDEIDEYRKCLR